MPARYSNLGEMSGPVLKAYIELYGKDEVDKSLTDIQKKGEETTKKLKSDFDDAGKALMSFGEKGARLGGILTQHVTVPLTAIGTAAALSTIKLLEMPEAMDKLSAEGRASMYALRDSMDDFKDSTIEARVQLAEAVAPVMKEFVDQGKEVIEVLGDMAEAWGNQSDEAKEAQIKLAAIALIAGPVVKGLSDMAIAVGILKGWFDALKISASLAAIEITALIILIGGAKLALDPYFKSKEESHEGQIWSDSGIPGISQGYWRDKTEKEKLYDLLNKPEEGLLRDYLYAGGKPAIPTKPQVKTGGGGAGAVPKATDWWSSLAPNLEMISRYKEEKADREAYEFYMEEMRAGRWVEPVRVRSEMPEGMSIQDSFRYTPYWNRAENASRMDMLRAKKGGYSFTPPEPGAVSPWTNDAMWGLAGGVASGAMYGGGAGAASALFSGAGALVGGPAGMALGLIGGLFGMGKQRGQTPSEPVYVKEVAKGDLATAILNISKTGLSQVGITTLDSLAKQAMGINAI